MLCGAPGRHVKLAYGIYITTIAPWNGTPRPASRTLRSRRDPSVPAASPVTWHNPFCSSRPKFVDQAVGPRLDDFPVANVAHRLFSRSDAHEPYRRQQDRHCQQPCQSGGNPPDRPRLGGQGDRVGQRLVHIQPVGGQEESPEEPHIAEPVLKNHHCRSRGCSRAATSSRCGPPTATARAARPAE